MMMATVAVAAPTIMNVNASMSGMAGSPRPSQVFGLKRALSIGLRGRKFVGELGE
jgi:hypothetical protein